MKSDKDFIDYWNRRVEEEKREENKGWFIVIAVWVIAFIVFLIALKKHILL